MSLRLTDDEYVTLQTRIAGGSSVTLRPSPVPTTKYGNIKTHVDGFMFDSKAEATRYGELKLQVMAGEITQLEVHPIIPIIIGDTRICDVELDFAYFRLGNRVWEDVKGKDTDLSKLKRKLLEAQTGMRVTLIRKRR